MRKPKAHFISRVLGLGTAFFLFAGELMAQPSGPPPIPAAGSEPPCWPPPCIPIDQGTVFLIAGAVLLGTWFLVKQRKGFSMEPGQTG